MESNFYILTGAPGVGKTTLIRELAREFATVDEPARAVIAQQRAIGGEALWEKNPLAFVEALLAESVKSYKSAPQSRVVFFDRGMADNLAYALYGGLNEVPFAQAIQTYKYNSKVFVLPPWEEIYTTDDERKMNFSEVLKFHECVLEAYGDFQLINVPKVPVRERASFIIEQLG